MVVPGAFSEDRGGAMGTKGYELGDENKERRRGGGKEGSKQAIAWKRDKRDVFYKAIV